VAVMSKGKGMGGAVYPIPSPDGRGLERSTAKPSSLRERVWVDRLEAAPPLQPADPHPALRATFSHWEKEAYARNNNDPSP